MFNNTNPRNNPNTARPSLVIGLGGTGSWVLSWLKKDLVETYGSRLKDQPIRLLLLDVAPLAVDVGGNQAGGSGTYGKQINLDVENEFLRLPTDQSGDLARRILQGAKDIESFQWLTSKHFDNNINITEGAGRFRQLGRLALLQGLHSNGVNDPLYTRLSTLIDQIRARSLDQDRSIDVHIVGSFAGGTGSGMFLDIAWLVRILLKNANISQFINGMFALPTVFGNTQDVRTRAKNFNAWRELNRMMTVESPFNLIWGQNRDMRPTITDRVFDNVYLVDTPPNVAAGLPEDTVFPIMAEALSFLLDAQAGQGYVQHVQRNLQFQQSQAFLRGRPTFSVLNLRAWKLPNAYNRLMIAHALAKEYLRQVLGLIEVQELDATSQVTVTKYRLAEGTLPGREASKVLSEALVNQIESGLLKLAATVNNISSADRKNEIIRYANANITEITDHLAALPKEGKYAEARVKIEEIRNQQVPVQPPDNDRDTMAYYMSEFEREWYGGPQRPGGKYILDYGDNKQPKPSGEFYAVLGTAVEYHAEIFGDRLAAWIREILRIDTLGFTPNGLATVMGVLDVLERMMNNAIDFFGDVEKSIPDSNAYESAAKNAYKTAYDFNANANAVQRLLGMVRGKIQTWNVDEQSYLAVQRDRRVIQRVITLFEAIKNAIGNKIKPAVQAVTEQLVEGSSSQKIISVYYALVQSEEDERARFRDGDLQSVIKLLGHTLARGMAPVDSQKLTELLNGTRWKMDGWHLSLEVTLHPNASPVSLSANLKDPTKTQNLVRTLIYDIADQMMDATPPINATDLLTNNHWEDFTTALRDVQNYLFRPSLAGAGQAGGTQALYVRAMGDAGQNSAINNQLVAILPAALNRDVSLVPSSNPDKVVIFSTLEVLPVERFAEWKNSREAYKTIIQGNKQQKIDPDPESIIADHLFIGEQTAVGMESSELKKLHPFITLDHRLIHILEKKNTLELFLQAWALGWIKPLEDYGEIVWQLHNTGDLNPLKLLVIDRINQQQGETFPDMLTLVSRFVVEGVQADGSTDFNYARIQARLIKELKEQWLANPTQKAALKARYLYEAEVAERLATMLFEQRQLGAHPDNYAYELAKAMPVNAQATISLPINEAILAYHVALDYTVVLNGGEALVKVHPLPDNATEIEVPVAHQQMLMVVLPQLFRDLAGRIS